jgi:hypothetical protein
VFRVPNAVCIGVSLKCFVILFVSFPIYVKVAHFFLLVLWICVFVLFVCDGMFLDMFFVVFIAVYCVFMTFRVVTNFKEI